MRTFIAITLAALTATAAPAAGPAAAADTFKPSVAVQAAIARPMDALDTALKADAALPPPASDRERLERMGRIDQSWRRYMGEVKVDGLSREDAAAFAEVAARTEPVDRAHLDRLLAMLPSEGWFSFSAYGREAATAAFHIVQHGDVATMKALLPALEAMAKRGEADRGSFAAMHDRVQVAQGRPQRFGTQFRCVDHRPQPYPLEDASRVEALRAEMDVRPRFDEHLRGLAERDVRC